MGSVVGITAYLQAKNELVPEFRKVARSTKEAQREMLGLDDATQAMIKEMRKFKQSAEQAESGFKREIDQMQREIQDLRRQLRMLDSVRAIPKVSVDDQARREIAAIRQEVKALDGTKAKVQVEASQAGGGELAAGGMIGAASVYLGSGFIDSLILETQANARRALLGDTPDELAQYQRRTQELATLNPSVDRTYIKELMTQATRFDSASGAEITKQAVQLNAIRPDMGGVEEYQKAMFAMQQAWEDIKDVGRFGDTLAEIARTTTDIRGEALDSIIEYSTQVTKFLDTPEKLAALTKEMNNLWSIDKGFDALKEATIKLDNQGDMVNVLKTAYEAQGMDSDKAQKRAESESKTIATAIHSDSVAENQFAVAALLQTFGGIQDQKVRQELLNELGAGPGEDIAKAFAPLLQAAGRIGMDNASQYDYQGQLDQMFKKYQENDPLRGFIEAKTMLSNELINLGLIIAQDLSPVISGLGHVIRVVKDGFDALPTTLAVPSLVAAIGLVTYGLWKFKVALAAAEAAAVRKKLGGEMPDVDLPDKKGKGGKGGGTGKGSKRQWWNPMSWGGKDDPAKKAWLSAEETKKMAFGGSVPPEATKSGWREKLRSVGGLLPDGDTVAKGAKSAWEGVKSTGGFLARKLPYIGAIIGAGQILTADDKLDMAGKVGSEALGGWGGAAAGAAIGSVVPGLGTAIGGIVGGIAGALGGGALFDKVKTYWQEAPPTPEVPKMYKPVPQEFRDQIRAQTQPAVLGPPIPVVPPVKAQEEKPKLASLTISAMPITLKADGVLQDVAGMLRLLRDPSVSNEIKRIIEKAFIDSLETRGGAVT
ncbi:hypothetical protein H7K32_11380 [Brevibacillus agri]|uniref:hypothetical protein n=1 Tax=Brevibacillus agri TaxID=51101 RepID=UPI001C8E8136|nr:hypothetical protein [Brevibacillus agri]MBY0052273.1 hypothetical protein [Brevibacillus agri]